MIVITEDSLESCTDPVIWTNIAHALACEVDWGLPSSEHAIYAWGDADFSQVGVGSRQHEHIWIGGHGQVSMFDHTDALQDEDSPSPLVKPRFGLPAPAAFDDGGLMVSRGPVVSGITIQSCHGAEGGLSASKAPTLMPSNLSRLTRILSEHGYGGIRSTAYVGRVISAPVVIDGMLAPSRSIKPDDTAQTKAIELQAPAGKDAAWKAAERAMAQPDWATTSFADRARRISAITKDFYKEWLSLCEKAKVLMPVEVHARNLSSHDTRDAAHLRTNDHCEVQEAVLRHPTSGSAETLERNFQGPVIR